ncbi:MAG: prepilin-type N-terminal cleavage/methylation domain-containing protein [Chloroflexota bacterium]|nr:prepilin-type N-terminal cleavage/methylation domain-containing protein [Chloroflexota bacterium]
MNTIVWNKKKRLEQSGFTLIEFSVSLAITAIILVSSMLIFHHVAVVSATNAERTIARLQIQYVSLWISEDVVQAQEIDLGNSTGTGFPLTVSWTNSEGKDNVITYSIEDMADNSGRKQMIRIHEQEEQGNSTSLVAEFLDAESTRCYRKSVFDEQTQETVFIDVLVLDAAASVGLSESSGSYEVHPRNSITW